MFGFLKSVWNAIKTVKKIILAIEEVVETVRQTVRAAQTLWAIITGRGGRSPQYA